MVIIYNLILFINKLLKNNNYSYFVVTFFLLLSTEIWDEKWYLFGWIGILH